MINDTIGKIVERKDLTQEEAAQAMEEIMSGKASPAQISAFIVSLRMKGETADEITGCAEIMRRHALKIKVDKNALDTCGTGGDCAHTFNISTVSAFVAAGAGAVVAKHGNKSVSSKCGSADLLTELGVNINIEPKKVEECIAKIGIGFLFAPLLHSAMKYAAPVRKEIGIRTIFNILGPLTNPAGARYQLLGVYDEKLLTMMAQVLGNLGAIHALIVRGEDGLDEVTTTSDTKIAEFKDGKIKNYHINPKDFGIAKASLDDLKGGDAKQNAKIALDVLNGKKGSQRDIVLLNAGCALYAALLAKDIKEGIKKAEDSIDSKKALKKLEALKEITNK